MRISEIAVIGSGQMGSGIAQVASLAGYSVLLMILEVIKKLLMKVSMVLLWITITLIQLQMQ